MLLNTHNTVMKKLDYYYSKSRYLFVNGQYPRSSLYIFILYSPLLSAQRQLATATSQHPGSLCCKHDSLVTSKANLF